PEDIIDPLGLLEAVRRSRDPLLLAVRTAVQDYRPKKADEQVQTIADLRRVLANALSALVQGPALSGAARAGCRPLRPETWSLLHPALEVQRDTPRLEQHLLEDLFPAAAAVFDEHDEHHNNKLIDLPSTTEAVRRSLDPLSMAFRTALHSRRLIQV